MKRIVIYALAIPMMFACSKADSPGDDKPVDEVSVSVEFDHIAGGANLQLNTGSYTNSFGQSFKVTKLKYFVSNFIFTRLDGTSYTVPQGESYFLIDESISTSRNAIMKIPEGVYKSVSFVLGVDSLRNTTDVAQRTGVLDVSGIAADMYWAWNSGYIFFKMEGSSPAITTMGGVFQFHVGGFGGYSSATANNLRTITLDLTTRGTLNARSGHGPNVHLLVDVLKAINGVNNIDFSTTSMAHSPAAGIPIANNYTSMFYHDHTEN